MDALAKFARLKEEEEAFLSRHIGPTEADVAEMLKTIGVSSLTELIETTIPSAIRSSARLDLPPPAGEAAVLAELAALAAQNVPVKSLIGQGYYGTYMPAVIRRNVLENPGFYTAYTPYQAEIAQGRLEALLLFQTLVCDLTAMEIANASLLDEGTAAAEAVAMAHAVSKAQRTHGSETVAVCTDLHPQTRAVLATR